MLATTPPIALLQPFDWDQAGSEPMKTTMAFSTMVAARLRMGGKVSMG